MAGWDGLDRRKFPRVNYPCLVVIRHDSGADRDVILTHTENVGIGGVCLILKQDLKMFCPVEIELDLLDLQEHIKCPGKVVWNVQRKTSVRNKPLFYDVGIEFQDISEKDEQRLQGIVERLVRNNQAASQPDTNQ